jgi:membrane protein DedA with SNARE-associated domain
MSSLVVRFGPLGVFLLMIPESACLPIPSEVTLLTAGFGVHEGWFSFPVAVAAATAGNLTGSLIAYWVGRGGVLSRLSGRGGAAIARCEGLISRRGASTVFVARLLPLARTFVSLPAGRAGVPLVRFVALTVAGCAIWCAAFVSAGALAGNGWVRLATAEGRVSLVVVGLAAVAFVVLRRRSTAAAGRGPSVPPRLFRLASVTARLSDRAASRRRDR